MGSVIRHALRAALWRSSLPLLLLTAIWLPEWSHFRIDRADPDPSVVTQGIAIPSDAVLDELADVDLAEVGSLGLSALSLAGQVAEGTIDIPGLSSGRVALRGHPHDHQVGPPTFRLFMASLAPERLLLQAFAQTGEDRWLDLAVRRTLEMASHERAQTHDRGFLWNDHAVAARVTTLVRLWADVRKRPAWRDTHGPALIAFAQRSGRMLAKPSQFTVRTNHGVMQNLALLQLTAAFPWLPESPGWKTLARERLTLQWAFYFSPEGVTLEHSAGYHQLGTVLAQRALRLYHLNGLAPDDKLLALVAKAQHILALMMRPDGSLPPIGNTDIGAKWGLPPENYDGRSPLSWLPAPDAAQPAKAQMLAASGWAIWWSGDQSARESQVMLTWAKHDGHGHKHADEGALVWWALGQEWLGTVGYWPYGDAQVRAAYGWRSANAPHLPGETARAARHVRLLGSGETGSLRMAEVERRTADGALLRRQVLQLDSATLLVLDFHTAAPQGIQTLWTLGPSVQLQQSVATERQYAAQTQPRTDGLRLALQLTSTGTLGAKVLRGSREPFGGWATIAREPQPVDALEVTHGAVSGAVVSLFRLGRDGSTQELDPVAPDTAPDRWQLKLRLDGQPLTLNRQNDQLQLTWSDRSSSLSLLAPGPELETTRRALRDAYARAVDVYPPWRDLWRYREQISQHIVVLAVVLELVLLAATLKYGHLLKRWRWWLNGGLAAAWCGVAAWVLLVHLQF